MDENPKQTPWTHHVRATASHAITTAGAATVQHAPPPLAFFLVIALTVGGALPPIVIAWEYREDLSALPAMVGHAPHIFLFSAFCLLPVVLQLVFAGLRLPGVLTVALRASRKWNAYANRVQGIVWGIPLILLIVCYALSAIDTDRPDHWALKGRLAVSAAQANRTEMNRALSSDRAVAAAFETDRQMVQGATDLLLAKARKAASPAAEDLRIDLAAARCIASLSTSHLPGESLTSPDAAAIGSACGDDPVITASFTAAPSLALLVLLHKSLDRSERFYLMPGHDVIVDPSRIRICTLETVTFLVVGLSGVAWLALLVFIRHSFHLHGVFPRGDEPKEIVERPANATHIRLLSKALNEVLGIFVFYFVYLIAYTYNQFEVGKIHGLVAEYSNLGVFVLFVWFISMAVVAVVFGRDFKGQDRNWIRFAGLVPGSLGIVGTVLSGDRNPISALPPLARCASSLFGSDLHVGLVLMLWVLWMSVCWFLYSKWFAEVLYDTDWIRTVPEHSAPLPDGY